jgi:hypothetical protein
MAISLQQVGIRQSKSELLALRVDGTGTASVTEGGNHVTLTDNGSGDYTLTFRRPGRRVPVILGAVPLVANLQAQIVSVTASAVNVKFTNNSGTATDTQFHLGVLMYYDPSQH